MPEKKTKTFKVSNKLKDEKEKPKINALESPDLSFLHGEKIKPSSDIERNDFKDKEWLSEFMTYIRMLLSKSIKRISYYSKDQKEDALKILLSGSDKNIKYFIYGVTHQSVNPNVDRNYQTYEIIGDKFMYSSFILYLRSRYTKITEGVITNLFQRILSKKYQSDISQGIGLDNWVILPYTKEFGMLKPNVNFREDLLEAFFGVIAYIYDKENKSMYTLDVIKSYFELLFNERDFSVSKDDSAGDSTLSDISYVQQYFTRIIPNSGVKGGIYEDIIEINEDDELTEYKYIVKQRKDYLEYMNETFGINIPKNVFGYAQNTSKKLAKTLAYKHARDYMNSIGLTEELKNKLKKKAGVSSEYFDIIMKKAKKEYDDLVDVVVEATFVNEMNTVININGEDKDEIKYVIYKKIFKNKKGVSISDMEQDTIESYLKSKSKN